MTTLNHVNHLKVFQDWDSNRKEIAPETVDWSKLTAERFLYEDRGWRIHERESAMAVCGRA